MGSSFGADENVSTVLFVDDEANILASIRRAVVDEEYISYFAGSGAEALTIMEKKEISVIVTDMRMPGMDGLQLLKIVKEKYPNTVKIVLSGYTQLSQVLATVNQADIFNFIAKPWDMENELKYVINKAIEHYRLKKTEIQLKDKLEKRNAAYQNVLKKMENTSSLREKQIQQIRKITSMLLLSIEKIDDNESSCLAVLLNDYMERLPGAMDEISLDKLTEALQLLMNANPFNSTVQCKVNLTTKGNAYGSYELICFAVFCLLKFLSQRHNGENLHVNISSKETEDKIIFDFDVLFLDVDGAYESKFAKCSYLLAEEIFREVMDAKFVTVRKEDRQAIQLEFVLEKR